MRLLPRPARQNTVRCNRTHDKFGSQKPAQDLHDGRIGGHVSEHIALCQQVPDPALQVQPTIGLGLTLKMGDLVGLFGMGVDDLARLRDLRVRKQAGQQYSAFAMQQLLRNHIRISGFSIEFQHHMPLRCLWRDDSQSSCAARTLSDPVTCGVPTSHQAWPWVVQPSYGSTFMQIT